MQGISRTTGCKQDCRALAPGGLLTSNGPARALCWQVFRDMIAVLKGEVLQDAGGDQMVLQCQTASSPKAGCAGPLALCATSSAPQWDGLSGTKLTCCGGRKVGLVVLHTELAQTRGLGNTAAGARDRVRLLILVAASCEMVPNSPGTMMEGAEMQPWMQQSPANLGLDLMLELPETNVRVQPSASISCYHYPCLKLGWLSHWDHPHGLFRPLTHYDSNFPSVLSMNGTETSTSPGIAIHMEGRYIHPYKLHSSSQWWEIPLSKKHETCYLFKKFQN